MFNKKTRRKTNARAAAALIMAFITAAALLGGCKSNKPEKGEFIVASPAGGASVPILSDVIRSYYLEYEGPETADKYSNGRDNYYPAPAVLTWECAREADYYIVGVSDKKDIEFEGSEGVQYFVTVSGSVSVPDLFAGKKYYYRVFAVSGSEVLASVVFSFTTEDYRRTVVVDGVSNTRDLGGAKAMNGKRIRQGIVFRGAAIDGITAKGRIDFLEKLGIKTEIDLRTGTEISPVQGKVNVVSVKAPMYVYNEMGIDVPEYQPELAKEIKTFADPDNYPIYFHCAIGRDRTGTLACLLELILGVSEEDIRQEYVLSFLSSAGFADGVVSPSGHVANIDYMLNYLKGYDKGNVYKNTEKFLMDIGVTREEIDAIRANMLEG